MRIAPGYVPAPLTDDTEQHRPSPRREISCDFPPKKAPRELARLMRLIGSGEQRCPPSLSADEREFLEMRRRECGG